MFTGEGGGEHGLADRKHLRAGPGDPDSLPGGRLLPTWLPRAGEGTRPGLPGAGSLNDVQLLRLTGWGPLRLL